MDFMGILDPDFFLFSALGVRRPNVMGIVRTKNSELNAARLEQSCAQKLHI